MLNNTVDKIKEKYNKKLLEFVESEKSARIIEESIMKKNNREHLIEARVQENLEEIKKKNEEKASKHKAILNSLVTQRRIHEEITIERINRSSLSPRRIFTTDRVKRSITKPRTSQDFEIDAKLQELNQKLLRSSENYVKNIQEKVESIQTIRRRRNSLSDQNEYENKLKAITDKYENAVNRRQKLMSEFQGKVAIKENKEFEKYEKLRNLVEIENDKLDKQSKSIEEKDGKISHMLVEIKKKTKNKIEMIKEKKKIAEAGITENMCRLKKLQHEKKDKILEKHLEIERKKNEHLDQLECINKQIREKAMNFTIEKEKLSVLKSMISKTQNPNDVKKILEKYQFPQTIQNK